MTTSTPSYFHLTSAIPRLHDTLGGALDKAAALTRYIKGTCEAASDTPASLVIVFLKRINEVQYGRAPCAGTASGGRAAAH